MTGQKLDQHTHERKTDTGMAQLDVFFSLFGIILVVLAIIKLSTKQNTDPPNFSKSRTQQTQYTHTKVPVLGHTTIAHQVWYVTKSKLYKLDRPSVANNIRKIEPAANSNMLSLSEPDKKSRGVFFLDAQDPSGFFMQISPKGISNSAFFTPLTKSAANTNNFHAEVTTSLEAFGHKPIALFVAKGAELNSLIIETLAINKGISIKRRMSKLTLNRAPSMFFHKTRAR